MNRLIYFIIGFVIAYALVSSFTNNDPIVEEVAVVPGLSEAKFIDVTSLVGIDYVQSTRSYQIDDQSYLRGDLQGLFSGGADAADYDNDGDLDLLVTRLDGSDVLYRNDDGKFVDVSGEVGLDNVIPSNKVMWVDIDNDGWQDLIISTLGEKTHRLYINNKGEFTERVFPSSNIPQYGFGIATGDYDDDGYVDIMTSNWDRMTIREGKKDEYGRLYYNLDGEFLDVTGEMGVRMVTADGYGDVSFDSEFVDVNNDGLLDLLVAADFGNSRLYINTGAGFVDRTSEWNFGLDEFGMGITVGDYDGDGWQDVFVTSIYCQDDDCMEGMSGNKFYRNNGNGFDEVAEEVGVVDGNWGWETEFFDFDNDKDLDLIMVMGMKEKIMGEHDFGGNAVRLWMNDKGKFIDVTKNAGLEFSGDGRDVVIFDYDGDSDLDIFVVRNGENGVLFENRLL